MVLSYKQRLPTRRFYNPSICYTACTNNIALPIAIGTTSSYCSICLQTAALTTVDIKMNLGHFICTVDIIYGFLNPVLYSFGLPLGSAALLAKNFSQAQDRWFLAAGFSICTAKPYF